MSAVFGKAQLSDCPEMARLWQNMMEDLRASDSRIGLAEWSYDYYLSYLEFHVNNRDAEALVAKEGEKGAIIGFCLAWVAKGLPMFIPEKYGYLSDIVVDQRHQNQKIGKMLLERMEEGMRRRGMEYVQLHVYETNGQAINFWDKMGYSPLIQGRIKYL